MGYRGDDRSSERAAWGAQSPRQSSRQHTDYEDPGYDGTGYDGAGYDGAGYDDLRRSGSYGSGGNSSGGRSADGYGADRYGGDGYSSGGYGSGSYRHDSGPDRGGYGGTGAYSSGGYDADGHAASGGYDADDYDTGSHSAQSYHGAPYDTSYGNGTSYDSDSARDGTSYGSGSYGSSSYGSGSYDGSSYDSGSYGGGPRDGGSYGNGSSYNGGSHRSGGYPALGSGGYTSLGQGSGGYPALGHGSGGYPAVDPDSYDDGNDWYARSGPIPAGGFADTSAQPAIRDTPSRELALRDVARDPVRGYQPEPARPDPGLATTRQQVRYDESAYVSYPGYDGVEDDARGYDSRRGYDYDDYADSTRLDQVAIDYDSPRDFPGDAPGSRGSLGGRESAGSRGIGQALQADGLNGSFSNDPGQPRDFGQPGDFLTGPGKKPKKAKKQKDPRQPKAAQPKRQSRRALVLAVVAVAVVLVGAGGYGGYQLLHKAKANSAADVQVSQPLPTGSVATATQKCAQQLGQYCHIETRTDDPAALTISELFPPAIVSTTSKQGFVLAGTSTATNCSSAVYGADLAAQLKKGACNQALRASYVSSDKTIMGTIGVFNLLSTNQAHYAAKIINDTNFVLPLSSAHGIIAKLGQGTGVVEPEFKGHYLILTYAEFANLKAPSTTAQTTQLQNWENALVASTANVYLSQLMVNGDSPAASSSASAPASASPTPSASKTS